MSSGGLGITESSMHWLQRSDVEDELGRLQVLINILETLPRPTRHRVLDYLLAVFSEPEDAP